MGNKTFFLFVVTDGGRNKLYASDSAENALMIAKFDNHFRWRSGLWVEGVIIFVPHQEILRFDFLDGLASALSSLFSSPVVEKEEIELKFEDWAY